MANFEKFRRQYVSEAPVPLVAIRKKGILGLNKKAYEALGSPKAIELLYDTESSLIGLQRADRQSPDSYAVRKQSDNRFEIAGKQFLKHYNLSLDSIGGRRYTAEMRDGVLVVDTSQD